MICIFSTIRNYAFSAVKMVFLSPIGKISPTRLSKRCTSHFREKPRLKRQEEETMHFFSLFRTRGGNSQRLVRLWDDSEDILGWFSSHPHLRAHFSVLLRKRQQRKRRTTAERIKNEDENRKGRRGPLFGFSCGRSPKPGGLRTEPRAQRNVFNSPKAPQQGSRVSIASTNFPLAHFCSISSKGFSSQPFSLHKWSFF